MADSPAVHISVRKTLDWHAWATPYVDVMKTLMSEVDVKPSVGFGPHVR